MVGVEETTGNQHMFGGILIGDNPMSTQAGFITAAAYLGTVAPHFGAHQWNTTRVSSTAACA